MSHLWFIVRWLHLLAMAFFVGGQMMLAGVVVPVARRSTDRESLRVIARRFGYGTLVGLLVWHIRRPDWHFLEAIVFLLSLAIVWLGLYLANGYS